MIGFNKKTLSTITKNRQSTLKLVLGCSTQPGHSTHIKTAIRADQLCNLRYTKQQCKNEKHVSIS